MNQIQLIKNIEEIAFDDAVYKIMVILPRLRFVFLDIDDEVFAK